MTCISLSVSFIYMIFKKYFKLHVDKFSFGNTVTKLFIKGHKLMLLLNYFSLIHLKLFLKYVYL